MEKETFAEVSSSSAKPDASYGTVPWPLATVPAQASTPGDARDLSQYNFFQSADLGQFPGPTSRAPSMASSFGSMDSGVSHPPRSRKKSKKVVGMKYSDLTRRASDTHLSSTLINDRNRNAALNYTDFTLFPDATAQTRHPEVTQSNNFPPLLSHSLSCMLQTNGDPPSFQGHHDDLSDPPDIYAGLQEEQSSPSPEDMNPLDPDLVPREQELRFEGDLYTPRWVRGCGNKREGWCGICKPGRWLVLKNSAFWYDKSFTHGISATTGVPFQEPKQTRRMDGNPDVWEGLCGNCDEWIALVTSKKKGTTWFRHAYKCHQHPRITGRSSGLVSSQSVTRDTPAPAPSSISSAGTMAAAAKHLDHPLGLSWL